MGGHDHHKGSHDSKLCAMTCCPGRVDLKQLKPLVKNATFICRASFGWARRRT
jgi:hypothetical protein